MATNSNTLINQIHTSRITLLGLLKHQGFNIDQYNNFSINEVHIMSGQNQLDMLLDIDPEKENETGISSKKVFVKYICDFSNVLLAVLV